MSNETKQAELGRHPVYLDNERNWHPRQLPVKADHWEYDFHGFCGKVFFLSDGRIGIEHNGQVVVRSIEAWVSSAEVKRIQKPKPELYFE